MIFKKNCAKLKHFLISYVVADGYNIRFQHCESKRLLTVCAEGLPWRLWATYIGKKKKNFQIKSYKKGHQCLNNWDIRVVTSSWFAVEYADKIMETPKCTLSEFQDDVMEKYIVRVSMGQCYKAKKRILNEVEDALKNHYAKLCDYMAELKKSNQDNTIHIELKLEEGNRYFQRFYMGFDALNKGF